ncbi:MAG: signal peptide peptidase SppA [Spirochaetia bacterium]|nr:signal peptide peptidase SppA [Spirochaetota bacterium]MCX8095963.1 signal peptide peptidase SppA [Spirochaetota bacterium]MDW8113245.1 signal peptide peptidase SppA [Spirochaetia bacterium]
MSDKLKDVLVVIIPILLVVNIVIGIILVSLESRKSQVLTAGVSALVGNVGLIEIRGVIVSEDDGLNVDFVSAKDIAQKIKTFADTPNIKAIRIDVTSPGSSVSAAETVVSALDYARSKGKKIVVFMRELAVSGGYYVSAPADLIVASRGTIIGNIGVIVQSLNIKGLLEKIGVEPYVFKSGEYKDILSPYRNVSESERKIIQRIVDVYYNRFVEVILKYRGEKLKKQELLKIADGRIMIEEDALNYKLIDAVGDETVVEEKLKELTGEPTINYVKLPERRNILRELLRSLMNSFSVLGYNSPKVMYIMNN